MTVTAIPQTSAQTSAQTAASTAAVAAPAKRGKKKLIMILVAVLVLGGGGYWFVLKPKPTGPPQPGEVVKLDAIQINLAGTHYLRVGVALQLVAGAKEAEGSKALDATIDEFSGQPMEDVNDPAKRAAYKKALVKELDERYDGDVMGVYFTEFVTQ
jgi:flagellar FliL protein